RSRSGSTGGPRRAPTSRPACIPPAAGSSAEARPGGVRRTIAPGLSYQARTSGSGWATRWTVSILTAAPCLADVVPSRYGAGGARGRGAAPRRRIRRSADAQHHPGHRDPQRPGAEVEQPGDARTDRPQHVLLDGDADAVEQGVADRKSTRLNSSHVSISYAVFCLKKKKKIKSGKLVPARP